MSLTAAKLRGFATLLLHVLRLLLPMPRGSHLFSDLGSLAWEVESAVSTVHVNLGKKNDEVMCFYSN